MELDYAGVKPASEISFWSNQPGGSIDVERSVIAEFEKKYGIKVNLVTAGANYEEVSQKFQTAQTSRNVGDVVVVSDVTWFPAYLNGSIIPLEPALAASPHRHQWLPAGPVRRLPLRRQALRGPVCAFYTDLLLQQGPLPAGGTARPSTGNLGRGAQLRAPAKGCGHTRRAVRVPPEDQYPAWTMSNLVWGSGGAWSNGWDMSVVAGPQTRRALQFAQNSVKDGWAIVASGDPATPFAAGAISQVITSTGSLGGILQAASFDVGVGFLPRGPVDTTAVVPTGGAGLAIAAKSSPAKQLAAMMFVSYLTNADNTAKFSAATGYLPVQTAADMTAVYAKTPQLKAAVDQLSRARSQDYARVFLPGGDLAISRTIQTILTTGTPTGPALDSLRDELQRLYKRDVEPRLNRR